MDLYTLADVLAFHVGEDRDRQPIKIMTPDGERFDVLSLTWDDEAQEWVIVGE